MTTAMTPTAERAGAPVAEAARMLATLLWVVLATAAAVGALGAIPGRLVGDASGVARAATVAEAERRVGAWLYLPAYFPAHLAWPPELVRVAGGRGGAVELEFLPRDGGAAAVRLFQAVTPGEAIPAALLGDARVLTDSPTRVGARPARIATVIADGTSWTELSWQIDGREIRLRSRGEVDELYRMAHSARREGR
jgi:hypothetical protein